MEIPMLEPREWDEVYPLINSSIEQLQKFRQEKGATLSEALSHNFGSAALDKYEQLTGFRETNVDAIWHHQLSLYGPPCDSCGKPLRTPKAKLCAACGKSKA